MTLCTLPTVSSRPVRERRPGRPPSGKRLAMAREMPGKLRSAYRRSLDPCDNSNDSGLGFDHHTDSHHRAMGLAERVAWSGERAEVKRPRMDIKLEQEEVNDGYCFPDSLRTCKENSVSLIRTAPVGSVPSLSMASTAPSSSGRAVPRCIPLANRQSSNAPVPLTSQLACSSRYMDICLQIIKQPEQQHRARYQTEGSRGAVKDREGNGFPIVQLTGYYKPATLQVFIGTDVGKVAPHMFYQACKVSGKNSTPCVEKKIEGTCVIELQLDPSKEMSATCDCVGILKERNVDVEHRFPDQLGNRSKKKSTRCRMIFRCTLTLDDGSQETLQVCSQPIVCTQPPGVPEICKKSLTSCPASGGLELFVLGKNFLKDTKVFFQQYEDGHIRWEQAVAPDKEYLQQTHFVCVIPPYRRPDITEPVAVRLCVVSSGKTSESHQFVYTPVNGALPSVHVDPQPATTSFFKGTLWSSGISKREQDLGMMPPPESSMVPLATRRSSIGIPSTSEVHSPPLRTLKQEFIDESSQSSIIDPVDTHQERYRHISESSLDVHHGDSNISMINENSMDMMQHNAVMGHLNENSNLSIEDSVEMMVRRNSMSRSISSVCEHSVDINSNMSSVNEDSSCSTVMQNSSSVVTDRMVLSQPPIHQNVLTSGSSRELATGMVEKVMDLRMKMPIATVSDLANTSAPSIAALRRLGIMESTTSTLPAQSIQSVENYLTKIESKPHISMENIPNHSVLEPKMNVSEKLNQIMTTEQNTFCHQKILGPQAMLSQACGMLSSISQGLSNLGETSAVTDAAPVYLSSQRPFLSDTTQNETMNVVAKSEAAAIADQRLNEQTNVLSSSTTMTTLATALDNSVSTPINTEKLDAFVNSTVESHIGSPTRSESAPKDVLASKLQLVAATAAHPEIMLTSQDVMLNSSASLMVPPIINTTMASPSMAPEIGVAHTSPNISPDVILNSQISPSLMCRNTGSLPSETLLPTTNMPSQTLETALLSAPVAVPQQPLLVQSTTQTPSDAMQSLHSPIAVTLAAEPEKAVLLEAAVDFFQTQKKISELASVVNQGKSTESKEPVLNNMMNEIITMASSANSEVAPSQLQSGSGTNFIQPQFTTPSTTASNVMYPKAVTQETKQDFVIPLTVKEITTTAQSEKKNEDRMIPQAFTSLTENELINLINPSCFDQV